MRHLRISQKQLMNTFALEEIKDLSRRINKVIEGLKNVEVDYNSSAE
ncbi:Imm3 family immunity protein [Cerasibacillus terrae]